MAFKVYSSPRQRPPPVEGTYPAVGELLAAEYGLAPLPVRR